MVIDNSGKGLASLGRAEDKFLAHVAPGERVVPPVISSDTQARLSKEMVAAGLDPDKYIVGPHMSINPVSGQPEFGWLKKTAKSLKKAVKKIAPDCDMIFIIGSRNSSNSARLVEVAKKAGCTNSELIHSDRKSPIEQIKKCKKIGISSGASAPEQLVQNLINKIKENCIVSIEEIVVAEEKVVFKIPKELN